MTVTRHGVTVHIGTPPAASVIARELTYGAVVLTRPGYATRTAQAVQAETRLARTAEDRRPR